MIIRYPKEIKNLKQLKTPGFKFEYKLNNKKVTNKKILDRISKLKIPPMWSNVEISTSETDYLQVTGHDSKNRIQYIYHPLFITLTERNKEENKEENDVENKEEINQIKYSNYIPLNESIINLEMAEPLLPKENDRSGIINDDNDSSSDSSSDSSEFSSTYSYNSDNEFSEISHKEKIGLINYLIR
jgi:hypothetical protein